MIELISGLPRQGKTLFAITRTKERAEREKRPVFYAGLEILDREALPWTEIDPLEWHKCPVGSIIFIDEAWRQFKPLMRGAPLPPHIEALSEHGHYGHDLVLITQHPMDFDTFVRRRIGLHFHVVRKFGTHSATVHEWAAVKENCDKHRDDSTRHEFRYPKKVFDWYKSSELHTVKVRIPARIFILIGIILLVAVIGYRLYDRWQQRVEGPEDVQQPATTDAPAPDATPRPASHTGSNVLTQAGYLEAHRPRVAGLDYTAPIYDGVTKPTHAPYPAACVSNRSRCTCYSQQGTRLAVPAELCASIVAGGFFLAWDAQTGRAQPVAAPRPPAEKLDGDGSPGWISLGGERTRVAAATPPSKATQSATGTKQAQALE